MDCKKVLVIDDSETMRTMVRTILTSLHLTVESAENGKTGYQKYIAFKPDAIITDFNMPIVNGEEFLRMVRSQDKETPVIFLTTEMMQTLRDRILAAGANGWIVKPLKPQVIVDLAKNLFR